MVDWLKWIAAPTVTIYTTQQQQYASRPEATAIEPPAKIQQNLGVYRLPQDDYNPIHMFNHQLSKRRHKRFRTALAARKVQDDKLDEDCDYTVLEDDDGIYNDGDDYDDGNNDGDDDTQQNEDDSTGDSNNYTGDDDGQNDDGGDDGSSGGNVVYVTKTVTVGENCPSTSSYTHNDDTPTTTTSKQYYSQVNKSASNTKSAAGSEQTKNNGGGSNAADGSFYSPVPNNPFGTKFKKKISAFSTNWLGEGTRNWCGMEFDNNAGIASLSLSILSQAYGAGPLTYSSNPKLWQKAVDDWCGAEMKITDKNGNVWYAVYGDSNISDSLDLNLALFNKVAGVNAQTMQEAVKTGIIGSYDVEVEFTGRKFKTGDHNYPYNY